MQEDNLKIKYLPIVVQDLPYLFPWLKRLACIFREYEMFTNPSTKRHLSSKGKHEDTVTHTLGVRVSPQSTGGEVILTLNSHPWEIWVAFPVKHPVKWLLKG